MPTLTWIGRDAVLDHHNAVPYHLLERDAAQSAGERSAGNLLVQGDNLLALKALLPYYRGQVKCIYIDPPYNTGNEGWVYNDAVNGPEMKAWLGKVVGGEDETLTRHDRWLCMIYPRLALLRDFLREDGAIFISIDDNEVHHLRLLMDELFGARNFVATFVWQKRSSPDNDETFATNVHDYIICYAFSISQCRMNRFARTDEADARYLNPDNDPRGPWTSSDLTRREYREHDFYKIALPSGRYVEPAAGRSWSIPPESFERLRSDNRIWFGPNGDSMPRRKRFLSEVSQGMVPTTWWSSDLFGNNQAAKRELRRLLPGVNDLFATPKPVQMISRILEIATDPDSLILDSFAGSGTTGHAVLRANAADGGTRRFLLVEMDEAIAATVTAPRLRAAVEGRPQAKLDPLGGGFDFCRLGPPLFDAQGQIDAAVSFADLAAHVFFAETGRPLPAPPRSPLIGVDGGRALYLLYNGILGDASADGGNVLTRALLDALPPHDGPRVIYGEASLLSEALLESMQVRFKQLPYQIRVN